MNRFDRIIKELYDKYHSGDIVIQLCGKDITEYERGKIQGKIELLREIDLEIRGKDETHTTR